MIYKICNPSELYAQKNSMEIDGTIHNGILTINVPESIAKRFSYNSDIITPSVSIDLNKLKMYHKIDIFCDFPNLHQFDYDVVSEFINYLKYSESTLPKFRVFKDVNSVFVINCRKPSNCFLNITVKDDNEVQRIDTGGDSNDDMGLLSEFSTDPNAVEASALNYRKHEIIFNFCLNVLDNITSNTANQMSELMELMIKKLIENDETLKTKLYEEIPELESLLNSITEIPISSILSIIEKNNNFRRLKSDYDDEIDRIESRLEELRTL